MNYWPGSLKIRIRFDFRRIIPPWSRLVEKVLNYAERIQELRLTVPEKVLPEQLALYAPRSQILDIHSRGISFCDQILHLFIR